MVVFVKCSTKSRFEKLIETHNDLKPDVYVMQLMTFMATCWPCEAQYVRTKYDDEYPRAIIAITQNHYFDGVLDSVNKNWNMALKSEIGYQIQKII